MPAHLDYGQIAVWIHRYYKAANPGAGYVDFDQLPEFLKADNRDAAMRIGSVLTMVGLRLEHRNGEAWGETEQGVIRQTIEDSINLLAEAEHEGWVESRVRNGWQTGDRKDTDKREHHLLASYSRLADRIKRKQVAAGAEKKKDGTPMSVDEEVDFEKDKDRDSVRNYVDIIARTDYRIVREV